MTAESSPNTYGLKLLEVRFKDQNIKNPNIHLGALEIKYPREK